MELSAKPEAKPFLSSLLRELTLKLFRLSLAGALFFGLLGFLGRVHRFGELSSHFRAQYFFIACVCAVAFAFLRHWRWAAAAFSCAILNGALIAPWYYPLPVPLKSHGHNFRVLLSNVQYSNRNYDAVRKLIERENPDLILLQEAVDHWQEAMKSLRANYPHSRIVMDGARLYTACYSRLPLEETVINSQQIAGTFSVTARLRVRDTELSFVSIHPPVPTQSDSFAARNEQLAQTAQLLRQLPEPKMLIGDLNVSLWSPYFSQLVMDSGLKVARKGFGVLPTWPTFLPPMMIPIDHCLVSNDLIVTNCRRGERIGSDHLPLIVDLMVPTR